MKLNKIKSRLFVLAIAAIILTFVTQGSLAYYTTLGVATNVITTGGIKMKIHETTDQGTEFPKEGVYIIPGDIVSKKVTVENYCDEPFYLRVRVVYGIDSQILPAEECFKLNINSEHWELVDGWYYYKGIVNPGETTPHVFSHVEIVGAKVDNRYIGKTLTLTVDAQAVQTKNNPVENNATHTAFGWPES